MIHILFSYPTAYPNEINTITTYFSTTHVDFLHIRKKGYSLIELISFMTELPNKIVEKTVVHVYNKDYVNQFSKINLPFQLVKTSPELLNLPNLVSIGCHSFIEIQQLTAMLTNTTSTLQYVFLSPIYDSISKKGYKSNFSSTDLHKFLQQEFPFKIIALGGISHEHINKIEELGFDGYACLGSFWIDEKRQL